MGLEPIWKTHACVLVSDAGGVFANKGDRGFFRRLYRYQAIQENQSRALRKRWLISNFELREMKGTYWGVSSAPSRYGIPGGYSKELATEVISEIRTDLDAFSDAEAAVLENHGYLLADAAIRTHLADFIPTALPALRIPHPDWMDERQVREALKDSSKRKLFGRG